METDYQNHSFHPQPIAGMSNAAARALATYGGHVGPYPASTNGVPSNTIFRLDFSSVGQPIGGLKPDFLFGEIIVPPPGVVTNSNPVFSIDPETHAFYLDYADAVYAADVGLVTIVWNLEGGGTVEQAYLISGSPAQKPVRVFWTVDPFKGPPVDVSAVPEVVIHHNATVPSGSLELLPGNMLSATGATGKVLVEYTQSSISGPLLGFEIVDVKQPIPPVRPADIGRRLLPVPSEFGTNGLIAHVSRGLAAPPTDYVFQQTGGPKDNWVFPVRKTTQSFQIELYWLHKSLFDVKWPYAVDRFDADWPHDSQIYVRGDVGDLGPNVVLPSTLQGELLSFQEPAGHASLNGTVFSSSGAGHALLKYSDSANVWFEPVHSVLHDDATTFDLSLKDWDIAKELVPTNTVIWLQVPGYIYEAEGDRYNVNRYTWPALDSQVFGVNVDILEVWWYQQSLQLGQPQGVFWPADVVRHNNVWPTNTPEIVIASGLGASSSLPPNSGSSSLYVQNDPGLAGYNPNEEHAVLLEGVPYAARNDLNQAGSSEPFVLVDYFDVFEDVPKMGVWKVVATNLMFSFNYALEAGTRIHAPLPLTIWPQCPETYHVSGPMFKDRKLDNWAFAASDDGASNTEIVVRFYYPIQEGFNFPDETTQPAVGTHVPWLSFDGTNGEPIDVTYAASWPSNAPVLNVAETLVDSKKGLPAIAGQLSVDLLYQQSEALGQGTSVVLIDPTIEREVDLNELPVDVTTDSVAGKEFFTTLPPHLRNRLWYDPNAGADGQLKFTGEYVVPAAGEPYLLLNVLEDEDRQRVKDVSQDVNWDDWIDLLATNVVEVLPEQPFDSLALSAGLGRGTGYVTMIFANSTNFTTPADPISVEVIRVEDPLYRGEIKVVESDNPLDEILSLRHSGDFSARSADYEFEWRTLPPVGGLPPDTNTTPPEAWALFSKENGQASVTIEGPGRFTLSDNYFVMRYRPTVTGGPVSTNLWSAWTDPMLAEGWLKRALNGINPFEQRIQDFQDITVNSTVSMISQAGTRWRGNVPLNLDVIEDYGLIEIYETLLNRGSDLSIGGGLDYGPANDALLLAAGRISDLYMLLGNEAFADASDPTIAFGTDDATFGAEASSIFCFMNQVPTLLDEELALLRGRDNTLLPTVRTFPVHNRLIWNFTTSIDGGEVAYALNYNIKDDQGDIDGSIDEIDARALYPQGHGDAWGHYLSALSGYYRLLANPNFTWIPRPEAVLVAGVPVNVDFFDERNFAAAAATKARTGVDVLGLTYRQYFEEKATGLIDGLRDNDTERAWGVAEWASRAGQGTLFDWVMANALLPADDMVHTGIQKIDRSTVPELREIASHYQDIQFSMDSADSGLNPLGLAGDVIPFDVSPADIDAGKTHFEQIYDRALRSLVNVSIVFDHAKNTTQLLREQADSVTDFQKNVNEREADYENRLIEVFGYPYDDDIGPGKTYPSGYDGPDLYHYSYVDLVDLVGITPNVQTLDVSVHEFAYEETTMEITSNDVGIITYHIADDTGFMVKPSEWTGSRRAPGELQLALSDLIQGIYGLQRSLAENEALLGDIEGQHDLIETRISTETSITNLQVNANNKIRDLKIGIAILRKAQKAFEVTAIMQSDLIKGLADSLPRSVGVSSDASFAGRAMLYAANHATQIGLSAASLGAGVGAGVLEGQVASEDFQLKLDVADKRFEFELEQMVTELEQRLREQSSRQFEIQSRIESMSQIQGRFRLALAKGERLLQEREQFRTQSASEVQAYRYKDMAYRIFRNDALQKYRAAFDLAARYVYLAAKAYDYETTLLSTDGANDPGTDFLSSIVRARSIGNVINGLPQVGGSMGDPGLADIMARMDANWQVLEGRLGFNNPQTETGRFSVRTELFRISSSTNSDAVWRETLQRHVVDNVFDLPEFREYCIPFTPNLPVEPAIVVPLSTSIKFGENYFGHDLAGGDNGYDSSHFSTKVRSIGVWFENYINAGGGGLANQPRVYFFPFGYDVLRSPTDDSGATRCWKVFDQALPLPFQVGSAQLDNVDWIPGNDFTGGENFAQIRRFPSLRAYHDSGLFDDAETINNSRLIGRSVWNTQWFLIIPAGTLLNDRDEALARFIEGAELPGGQRDGNGVKDIKIFFQTYSYAGN